MGKVLGRRALRMSTEWCPQPNPCPNGAESNKFYFNSCQNTNNPPEISGVGLSRSSPSKLEGLHAFMKAGLSWYWAWAVLLFPFIRGLEGWTSENFHPPPGITQEGKTKTLSRYKLVQLVDGCRIQINELMRTNAEKWSVSVASRENIIGISQINQANMHQQDISGLRISILWITTYVFKKHSKRST